jgi:hypothetical protein
VKERMNTRRKGASELYKEAIGIEKESSDEREGSRKQKVEKRAPRTQAKMLRRSWRKGLGISSQILMILI